MLNIEIINMHRGKKMNSINKNHMVYLSVTALLLGACTTTEELRPQVQQTKIFQAQPLEVKPLNIKVSKPNNTWNKKSLPVGKIDEDCIDCYAKPLTQEEKKSNRTYYAKANTNTIKSNTTKSNVTKSIGGYKFVETDADRSVKSDEPVYKTKLSKASRSSYASQGSYTEYTSYSSVGSTAIQVGAFENYSGAKIYLERYNRFSNQYKVGIKTGTKNNKPIHRVQIVGFKNSSEAKRFMSRNGLSDAFLVK